MLIPAMRNYRNLLSILAIYCRFLHNIITLCLISIFLIIYFFSQMLLLRPFVHALLSKLALICSDILSQTPGGVATANVVAYR